MTEKPELQRRSLAKQVADPRSRTLENFFTWVLHRDTTGWNDLMMELRASVQMCHTQILETIRDRQADRASEAMAVHFSDVLNRLERIPPPTQ